MFHSIRPRIALVMAIIGVSLASSSKADDLIAGDGFDDNALNLISTQNVYEYRSGGGSGNAVFGVVYKSFVGGVGMPTAVADDSAHDVSGHGVDSEDTLGIAGGLSSAFFAMNNMGALSGLNSAVWSFDVSSAVKLKHIGMAMGAMGDFESGDGFLVEAQLDDSGYVEIYRTLADEDASLEYYPFDNGEVFTYDDPLELYVDGQPVEFGPYYLQNGLGAVPVSWAFEDLSGSTLDIRLTWLGNPAGDEPMGIDSISIVGVVPEPAALAILALGGLTVLRRRGR